MSLSHPFVPHTPASTAARLPAHAARTSAIDAVIESLARLGYVVRGIIYVLPGVLALQVALGRPGREISPLAAIQMIGHERFGQILLVAVAVGLAGYAVWGVVRAVFDPLRKGRSLGGLAQRAGFAVSAMAYVGLLVATFRLVTAPLSQGKHPADWTTLMPASPLGSWLLVIIGVCWIIGAGLAQIVAGWRSTFEVDLATERMTHFERRWTKRLGRFGIVSRGVVFTVIGVLIVAAARHAGSGGGTGMGGALLAILRQPFGRTLLAAAAVGLIAFGVFSALCARWMRIRPDAGRSPAGFVHPAGS